MTKSECFSESNPKNPYGDYLSSEFQPMQERSEEKFIPKNRILEEDII